MAEINDGPVVTAGVRGVVHQTVAHFKVVDVTATCEYNRVIASRIFDVVRFDTTEHTTHALGDLAVTEDQGVHAGVNLVEVDDLSGRATWTTVLQVQVFKNQAVGSAFGE